MRAKSPNSESSRSWAEDVIRLFVTISAILPVREPECAYFMISIPVNRHAQDYEQAPSLYESLTFPGCRYDVVCVFELDLRHGNKMITYKHVDTCFLYGLPITIILCFIYSSCDHGYLALSRKYYSHNYSNKALQPDLLFPHKWHPSSVP